MPGRIIAMSALCSAGRGVEQLWASVRAGMSRIGSSDVRDRRFQPIQMGLVPEDALEPELPPEVDSLPLPSRARRMLRLGAPALRSVLERAGEPPIRLYLGLPQLSLEEAPWMKGFSLYLAKTAGVALDVPSCRVVPAGRAAALVALELAMAALEQDPSRPVVIGGIDTYLDLKLLAFLDAEGRILGPDVSDGFIPGEGASFLVLAHPSVGAADGVAVTVEAATSARDPGHRSGTAPARGEGLATAIELLRSTLRDPASIVGSAFAGLNGESFDAKQWGVARMRHSDFFSPDAVETHPADCFGDAGAAMGALLLAIGARAIARRERRGPALIWAASDGETRACALLSHGQNGEEGATVPGTVFANTRGIAHKGSGGMSTIFPDVCKTPTPAGPVPIPYPNIGQSSNTSAGPTTVTTDGQMPMTKDAKYMISSGDEAGSAGGVMSGKIKGACEFMMYSFDVKFEGKNVCRLADPLFHNDKNGMG